jgi:hypothetical protein
MQKEYPNEQMEGDTDVEHMFPMVDEAPIMSNDISLSHIKMNFKSQLG